MTSKLNPSPSMKLLTASRIGQIERGAINVLRNCKPSDFGKGDVGKIQNRLAEFNAVRDRFTTVLPLGFRLIRFEDRDLYRQHSSSAAASLFAACTGIDDNEIPRDFLIPASSAKPKTMTEMVADQFKKRAQRSSLSLLQTPHVVQRLRG